MVIFANISLPETRALAGAKSVAWAWARYWGGVILHVPLVGDGSLCSGAVPRWTIPAGWSHWDATINAGRFVLLVGGGAGRYQRCGRMNEGLVQQHLQHSITGQPASSK